MRTVFSTSSDSKSILALPVRSAPADTGWKNPWWRLAVPLAILLLVCAGGAVAQTTDTEAAQDEEPMADGAVAPAQPVKYGEITVTAQKKEESLQEVPLSVTAFTMDFIQENNLTNFVDIAARTPSMVFANYPDIKLSSVALRGIIGGSGSAGADPAVARYVDEVYLGHGVGAFMDLFDLERTEVLRGPQGLFFGRNSIGGAVSYNTRKPSMVFDGMVEGTYGDYGKYRLGGLISGPLAKDRLAGKVSFVTNNRDGTYENLWLGIEGNEISNWSARGQLLWTPSAVTSVILTAEHSEVDQQTLSFETLKYNPEGLLPSVLGAYGLPLNEDPWDRKGYADIPQPETLDLDGYSVTVDTAIGDVGLTSITSYREHQYESRRDTSASQLRWAYDGDPEDVDRLSQELRIEWSTPKTSFLFGAYYFDQSTSNQSFVDLGEDLMDLLIGDPIYVSAGSDATMSTTSYAAFGNITFTLSERADASFGLRYTRDKKEIDYSQADPLDFFGGTFTLQAQDDWGEATPAFNVRYMFNDNVRGYVTVGRGFKSGGFNDALGSADGIAFGPEYLWNYEIGIKNRLAQGRVTANFALFYMDWSDIQIVTDNPNTPNFDPIIQNAGTAHSTGLEGEIFAYPSRHWVLGLNFSILEAEYDGGTLPDGSPLNTMVRAPDYTANLNAEYRATLSGSLEWFIGAEMLNTGEMWLYPDNQEDSRVAPHTIYNARLGFGPEHRGWSVTVWGRNLSDEIYKERLFDLYDQPLIAQKYIVLNDPMMWGATIRFAF